MEDDQSLKSDTVLTFEAAMDNTLCGSVDDCQNKFYKRFVRSMSKKEKRSIPLTLEFHNGDKVTTNLISNTQGMKSIFPLSIFIL